VGSSQAAFQLRFWFWLFAQKGSGVSALDIAPPSALTEEKGGGMNLRAKSESFWRKNSKTEVGGGRDRSTLASKEDAILHAILSVAGFFAIIFNFAKYFGF